MKRPTLALLFTAFFSLLSSHSSLAQTQVYTLADWKGLSADTVLQLNVSEYKLDFNHTLPYADMQKEWTVTADLLCGTLGTEQVFVCKEGKASHLIGRNSLYGDISLGYDNTAGRFFVEVLDKNENPHRLWAGSKVETGRWYKVCAKSQYDAKKDESVLVLSVDDKSNSLRYPGKALRHNASLWVIGHGFPGGFPNALQVRGGAIRNLCISGEPLPREAGQNPLFTDRFTADPAFTVVGNTVYAYVGEDCAAPGGWFNMPHWLCYSSTDMRHWTAHGPVLKSDAFPYATAGSAWAAQMVEKNGKYYFYVTLDRKDRREHAIDVAVSDSPTGPFVPARKDGTPLITDGMTPDSHRHNADIDPTVLIDSDGTPWMAWGNGDCYMVKLKDNMIELDGEIRKVPLRNYSEGPWLFKRGNLYYNVYASDAPGVQSEQIAYSTAENIEGPWTYRGFVSTSANHGFTIHPSVIQFKDKWYYIYHDGSYNLDGAPGGDCRRSVCAEYLHFNSDGTIQFVPLTQEGLNRGNRIGVSAKENTPLPQREEQGGEYFSGYLFAYFEGSGDQQEALRFAVSEDARNWYALNSNRPIVGSDTISESGGIRDPHILRGEDGCYYIVATDMHTFDPKQGWGSNPGIVLMKSKDLINWSHAKINLGKNWPKFSDAYWMWAPQTIYDRKAKKYMIYFTLQRTGDGRKSLITYYAYANKDFTAFESEPKQLFSAKYGSIDNDIIYKDGTYHLFYKGNTKDENGKEYINGIQQAFSKKLTGPWKEDFKYLDAYAGTRTHVEGSSVFELNPQDAGSSNRKYVLMYDLYSSGRYEYQTSEDLIHWTKEPQSFRKDFFPRHGSVISVTKDELERLQQQWGWVLTHSFESTGNPIIRDKHTADPAVLVEGDTLWLFAGHDMEGGQHGYVMKDWLLYSTTDMRHWTEHPSPLRIDDFKWADSHQAYAGHVVKGKDGRYYWYVSTNWCGIGVAVADKITGPYKDALGKPLLTREDCFASHHSWCVIDPAILIDDDGTPYIIWGNGQCYYAKLKDNMTEIDGKIHQIDVPRFTEAPWMHKYCSVSDRLQGKNGKYYLTYATEWPEKIAYAISDHIGGPYTQMGIISEIAGNSNTTHPAIVDFKGQWLFFSHNGGLPDGTSYSRSVIAEPLHYNADGTIRRIPPTAEGVSLSEE